MRLCRVASWESGKSLNYSANPVVFFGGSQGIGGANLKILEKCSALHESGSFGILKLLF